MAVVWISAVGEGTVYDILLPRYQGNSAPRWSRATVFWKKETQVDKSTGTKKLWKHIEYGLNKRDEGEETEVGVYGESQVSKSCRYI